MNPTTISRLIGAALLTLSLHAGADQGPSTSTAPYLQPIASGLQFTSILTTGDAVQR
jgi:hypothetical protein